MVDHCVYYIQIAESLKNTKPERMDYIFSKKKRLNRPPKNEEDIVYIVNFFGNKKRLEQKQSFIEYFLTKYYSNKDNYLWSFQENASLEDDKLMIIINVFDAKK